MTSTNEYRRADEVESLESFRARARTFVEAHLPRVQPDRPDELSLEGAKTLQAVIFDAGFAGIGVPEAYGGAGLTLTHQKVWAEEVEGFVVPVPLFVSIGMLGMTLLDHASEDLKLRHLPRVLRGEEVWLQLLSEPSGGSDMAGAMTRAERDGDTWVVNGAKMWSTGAGTADFGMCLARTDWGVPKHEGLSMFAVPLRDPQVTIEPIIPIEGGPAHFFQEYLDDVVLPLENLIGQENHGWSVAHSLLFHERNATAGVGHGLGLGGGRARGGRRDTGHGVEDLVDKAGSIDGADRAIARQLIGEAYVAQRAAAHAADRITVGMRTGAFKGDWGSLLKLGLGLDTLRRAEIGIALAAADGVIWTGEPSDDAGGAGQAWLTGRNISIAGGTNEMQRNIISERLLGMPRELATDRDVPFNEVVRRRDRS
jgi:alkylation response protein AidB-like acyl-CoA dehydrogenase